MMDFSLKSSASCFSSQCGMCQSCCGNIGGPTGRVKNNYYYPGYVDEKPLYEEDNKNTNWYKYQDMLKIAQEGLESVKDMYTEETPALTSELFAMREMGVPLEGSIRVQQGYLSAPIILTGWTIFHPRSSKAMLTNFPSFKKRWQI